MTFSWMRNTAKLKESKKYIEKRNVKNGTFQTLITQKP